MAESVEHYVVSDEEWANYKVKFGKNYQEHEEASKRQKWEETIHAVNAHNQEYKDGKHTYTQGVNQFADGSKPAMGSKH